jgi:hypothetical protein
MSAAIRPADGYLILSMIIADRAHAAAAFGAAAEAVIFSYPRATKRRRG